ncbi:MAG: sugar ABC transporter ATP-binding protein [Rhodospirillales bacterium]
MMTEGEPLLQATGLTKRYAGTAALSDVTLTVPAGQVVSVVGENGAGKSTLLNILSGIARPDAGVLRLAGRQVAPQSYADAMGLGISRVFQEQALIATQPIYENLLLSLEARFTYPGQVMRRRAMIDLAESLLAEAGMAVDVTKPAADYSFSERQFIEIARACLVPLRVLGVERPLVLLDEPTASLERGDEDRFFALIERLRGQVSFVFVSHRLGEVLALSNTISVLKDGRNVTELSAEEASEDRLHSLMVGRTRIADYYQEDRQRGSEGKRLLQVGQLGDGKAYGKVNLQIAAGEVLGIGGLVASGKSDLGRGVAGVVPPKQGQIRLGDRQAEIPRIAKLIRQGVGYVPAERLVEGMIPGFSLAWNLSLAGGQDQFAGPLGGWRRAKEVATAIDYINRLRIRAKGPHQRCDTLSGGNQQKVVLARWLCRSLRLLVLDNPTRGVDAGAKEEIYGFIRDLTDEGVAILLITDDLPELIGLSDRIAIMHQGRVTAEIAAPPADKPSEQALVAMMLADRAEAAA